MHLHYAPLAIIGALVLSGAAFARDLTLSETEALLVRNNRELLSARRVVESAEAQIVAAGARPNATLSMNTASISRDPGIGSGSLSSKQMDTVFRIDQPFERGDKRTLRMDAATGLQRAAQNDSLDVLRQQIVLLRGAYFDLKQAQEKAEILAGTADLFSGTLAAAQRRLKAGDLAAADVSKVQVDYERALNDARAARAEYARNQIALGYMIGLDAEAADLRPVDAWPQPERAYPDAVEQAIDARPDVLAARARVEAAEKLRDLARAQRTRDVTIGAQYEHFPGSVPGNSVGFGIAIPLFTGNDFSGDIQKAEVDRYAALDALARSRTVAGNDLRRAASDLNSTAERLERFDTSLLAAAGRSAQAAEFAFQRGAISVLEVLDARRTLRAVQLEALAARTEHAKALAAWRASLTSADSLKGR